MKHSWSLCLPQAPLQGNTNTLESLHYLTIILKAISSELAHFNGSTDKLTEKVTVTFYKTIIIGELLSVIRNNIDISIDVEKHTNFYEKYILKWLMYDWQAKSIKRIVQSIALCDGLLKIDSVSFWCGFIKEINKVKEWKTHAFIYVLIMLTELMYWSNV